MTHEEYKLLRNQYEDFLCEAEKIEFIFVENISKLEEQSELSEEETGYLDWMRAIEKLLVQLIMY